MKGSFEAKKHAIRQTQDGWVVSFVVHPSDMTPEFAASPLGTRLMVGYAEIGDDEQPVEQAPAKAPNSDRSAVAKDRFRDLDEWKKDSVRCGILCKDADFRMWVTSRLAKGKPPGTYSPIVDERAATEYVRAQIGGSRSLIADDATVHQAWLDLKAQYEFDTGQMAEMRR